MVMAALLPMFEKGIVQHYRHLGDQAAATQTSQAIQQRNSQWATEQNLFIAIMQPMMVYFEGFIFAVGPFMAFAIGLGPLGVRMVGKYLLFGLWIQLWMPILAISNLYLILTAQRAFEALATQNGALLPSFRALYETDLLLQSYLGTAGMLIASTPAISLMLIYGSAITATHLAGRLQGGDHINERLTAPDVMQPSAAGTVGPLMQTTALGGTHAPGAQSLVWSFKAGQSAQALVRSAELTAVQAQESFQSVFGQSFARSAAASRQTATQYALRQTFEASYSQADAAVLASAEELSQRFGASGVSREGLGTLISAGLKGRLAGASPSAIGADLAGHIRQHYDVSASQAQEMAQAIAHRVTTDQQLKAAFSEGLASDIARQHGESYTQGLNQSDSTQLTRSAHNVLSTSRSYEQAATLARSIGTDASFNAIETSGLLLANPALMNRLEQTLERFGLSGDVARQADGLLAGGVVGHPVQARAIAGLGLLLGFYGGSRADTLTPHEKEQAHAAAMGLYSSLLGVRFPEGLDPQVQAALATQAPALDGVRQEVMNAGVQDVRDPVAAGLQHHQINADGTITRVTSGREQVQDVGAGARQAVADQGVRHTNQLRREQAEVLADRLAERAGLPAPVARAAQEQVGGLLIQLGEEGALLRAGIGDLAGQGARQAAAALAYGQALVAGQGWDAARQAGREAAGSDSVWESAREAMIETRLAAVAGHGLTPAQAELYRATTETSLFAFVPSEAQRAARARVIDEAPSPAIGAQIATLIERSAGSREETDLRLIGAYNQTQPLFQSSRTPTPVGELAAEVLPPVTVTLPRASASGGEDGKKNASAQPGTGIGGLPLRHPNVTGGAFGQILDLIAAPESHGNYNAWYGQVDQQAVALDRLTFDEVRALQTQLLADGQGGSAIGRYQFLPDTLEDLRRQLQLTGEEPFTPALQDRLALRLLRESGVNDWIAGRLDETGLAHNLSRRWAALPKDASNLSYHAGVGANAAHVEQAEVVAALAAIRSGASTPFAAPAPVAGPDVVLSAPLQNPEHYPVTSAFSPERRHPVTGRLQAHRGVDLATPIGTPLFAPADGFARTGYQEHGAGHFIALHHGPEGDPGKVETKFFHLSGILVEPGQRVRQGDLIGYTGDSGLGTGPHLHYEVWRDGRAVDPRTDPLTRWTTAAGTTD
jgi:conjugal transfer mating pair stabilization protein TraG